MTDPEIFLAAKLASLDDLPQSFPVWVQGGTLPAVTYRRVQTDRSYHMQGSSCSVTALLEVSAWSTNYKETKQMAAVIREAVSGLREGDMKNIMVANEFDDDEPPIDFSDDVVYRVVLQLQVTYAEN